VVNCVVPTNGRLHHGLLGLGCRFTEGDVSAIAIDGYQLAVAIRRVATPVPMTAGIPYSLATMDV